MLRYQKEVGAGVFSPQERVSAIQPLEIAGWHRKYTWSESIQLYLSAGVPQVNGPFIQSVLEQDVHGRGKFSFLCENKFWHSNCIATVDEIHKILIQIKCREFDVLPEVLLRGCDGCVVRWAGHSILKDRNVFIFRGRLAGRLLAQLDPEDGDIVILQNIRNHLPDDSVSHPRRLEFNVVSSVESAVI